MILQDVILFLAHVVLFFWLGWKYGKDIIEGLKGDNEKWDSPEIIVSVWLVMFIAILLSNLFLNYDVSDNVWYLMELILLIAMGAKGVIEHINKRNDDKKSR